MVIFLCWSWVVHHIRHCNILGAWEWPATETVCFSPLKKTTHLEAWQSPTRCLAAPCPCTSSWEAQCLQWCWGSFQAWRLQFQNCFNFSLEISKIYYDKVVKDIRQWHIFYTCFILDTLYLIFETLAYIYIHIKQSMLGPYRIISPRHSWLHAQGFTGPFGFTGLRWLRWWNCNEARPQASRRSAWPAEQLAMVDAWCMTYGTFLSLSLSLVCI